MTLSLDVGQRGAAQTTVTTGNTAIAMGSGSVPVYATPALVALLEAAAVDALTPQLETGKTSVGTHIAISHVAATPVGQVVRAEATLTIVDGRRLTFHVVAHDEVEMIAEGTHERIVVDEQRFLARVREKASRAN